MPTFRRKKCSSLEIINRFELDQTILRIGVKKGVKTSPNQIPIPARKYGLLQAVRLLKRGRLAHTEVTFERMRFAETIVPILTLPTFKKAKSYGCGYTFDELLPFQEASFSGVYP